MVEKPPPLRMASRRCSLLIYRRWRTSSCVWWTCLKRSACRTIGVTTAEDLILLKMAFHRQKDLQDIRGILHIQGGRLDVPYLRGWSREMLEADAAQELDELLATYKADRPAGG
jgi:hypothetical protein